MMEAARTSETLVNFYQTTRCYNPEDSNLHDNERSGSTVSVSVDPLSEYEVLKKDTKPWGQSVSKVIIWLY
jgi:hypothetical protein